MSSQRETEIAAESPSGMGLSTCRALPQHGCGAMPNGVAGTRTVTTLRRGLADGNGTVLRYSGAGVHDLEAINTMIEAAREAFGGSDALIDSANVDLAERADQRRMNKRDAVITMKLSTAAHVLRSVLHYMAATARGRIINIGAALGLVPPRFGWDYLVAKHEVVSQRGTLSRQTVNRAVPAV